MKAFYVSYDGGDQEPEFYTYKESLEIFWHKSPAFNGDKKLVLVVSTQNASAIKDLLAGGSSAHNITVEQITTDSLDDDSKLHGLLVDQIEFARQHHSLEGV